MTQSTKNQTRAMLVCVAILLGAAVLLTLTAGCDKANRLQWCDMHPTMCLNR